MAKRHHKSHRGGEYAHNSMHEDVAMSGRMRSESGYESYDESKRMMRRDSGMIHEDASAACMLPTHIIEKQWAGAGNYMHKGIGSLFSGVQETMKEDGRAFEKSNKPRQY